MSGGHLDLQFFSSMRLYAQLHVFSYFFLFVSSLVVTDTIYTLPRILGINLSFNATEAKAINSLVGKIYTHSSIPQCSIKVGEAYVLPGFNGEPVGPDSLFFRADVICQTCPPYELPRSTICMSSRTHWDMNSFFLEKLSGSLQGCPSGRVLLNIHHEIARQIGASSSLLQDASQIEVFRGSRGTMLRSVLLNTLLGSYSIHSSSYYFQFGYGLDWEWESIEKIESMEEAHEYIQQLTIANVTSMIDLSKIRGRSLLSKLQIHSLDLAKQAVSTTDIRLVQLLQHLHSSSDPQDRFECIFIIDVLIKEVRLDRFISVLVPGPRLETFADAIDSLFRVIAMKKFLQNENEI